MSSSIYNRKILIWLITCIVLFIPAACQKTLPDEQGTVYSKIPDNIIPNESYIFYIHGKIIETEGIDAVSPEFGTYEFKMILEYFAEAGFNVIGEVRDSPPDPDQYAAHIGEGIQYLKDQGLSSNQITIIGFSKGGGLTISISNLVKDQEINYVLIGVCGDWIDPSLKLTGKVLSLYEESDPYGSSCQDLADRSPDLVEFKEIAFNTGKSHGTFYTADPKWMDLVVDWLNNRE
jgi:hypothetical protein